MKIEVAVLIDGEPAKANSDLHDMLVNLVNSYIKHKFFITGNAMVKEEEEVKPKRYKTPRNKMTPDEIQNILVRGEQLKDLTLSAASKQIMSEVNRSWGGVYRILAAEVKKGNLVFAPNKYNAKEDNMSAIKNAFSFRG